MDILLQSNFNETIGVNQRVRKKRINIQDAEVPQKRKGKFNQEKRFNINIVPKNENQSAFMKSILENVITFGYGSAGTGKSFLSMAIAVDQISKGNFDRIVLCRANVSTGKTLGHYPGTPEEKLTPWLQHLISYAKDFAGVGTVNTWMRGDTPKIILEPIETIRGRSFSDSIIIVDEAQQLQFEEIKCLSTRIGENTKIIFCGDPSQKDIQANGMEQFVSIVEKYKIPSIGHIKFGPDDIVRSDIVKRLIMAFEKEGI